MNDDRSQAADSNPLWKPGQTYAMAALCLVIGLAIGYLVRGSASPAPMPVAQTSAQPAQDPHAGMPPQTMPSLDDMKQMGDKGAEPLLAKLKADPNNADLLNQVGTVYRATHQFKTAIGYYQKSLAINAKNVGARTDMASCMYYLGDVDGALAELNRSLTYDPKHASTLMNIGIIRWKGKNDVDGAIAAWQKALKLNPDLKNREVVEHMIEQAKQQGKSPEITGVKG